MRWWNRFAQRAIPLLPAIAMVGAVALRVAAPPPLEAARDQVFDAYQRWHPRPQSDLPVRIIDLDDETLQRAGQWPWPRTQVALLIAKLNALEAAVIALDIVFAEPDRTSPRQILPLWGQAVDLADARGRLEALPDHDAVLAQAIAGARVVTGFSLSSQPNAASALRKAAFAYAGENPEPFLYELPGVVPNLPELEQAAAGNGHFNLVGERDGVVRRVPLLLRHGADVYPSLALEALRVLQGASTYAVKSSGASGQMNFGERTGLTHVKAGKRVIPTDANGRVWVYYAREDPQRWIPAWKVLDDKLPAASLKGAIVFVGTSASGLRDLRTTPLEPYAPGISVHAQLTEQILDGQFLLRPDWADGAELLYLILLGGVLLLLLPRLGAVWCAGLGILSMAAAAAASWYAFVALHWLVDAVMPSLAALLIYLLASLSSFLRTEGERRRVRDAFSHYLSPVLVDRLAAHPEQLTLGGESRPMTVLFADIRGFTTMAEKLDARALTQLMNRFFTHMTRVVQDHGGTIDKYIGDCIMAFWNAPMEDARHERRACEAALAMQQALADWNAQVPEHQRIGLGIGANTGECCVGNMGSEQRFDYSVLGDPVNLASRLESQSKVYGVDIIVGPDTAAAAPDLLMVELDWLRVKGKTEPIRIFALLGGASVAARADVVRWRQAHALFLAAYRAGQWDEALRLLEDCVRQLSSDLRLEGYYRLYRERVAACKLNPPGPGWDGVWVAAAK